MRVLVISSFLLVSVAAAPVDASEGRPNRGAAAEEARTTGVATTGVATTGVATTGSTTGSTTDATTTDATTTDATTTDATTTDATTTDVNAPDLLRPRREQEQALRSRTLADDAPLATAAPPSPWLVPTLHTVGVLAGMRVSLSVLWPEYFDPTRFKENAEQFGRSWSGPPNFRSDRSLLESDGDPWVLNTIGHGLFGAEVYLRFRQCGHLPLTSFAAAGISSTVWEYGPEALHKQPSAIDLIWTPLVGTAIGEGRYQLYRAIRANDDEAPGGARGALLFVIDPFGEAERRLLGTGC